MERIYARDKANGIVVYRIPGHRHGDGQIDSDDAPVWLAGDETDLPDGVTLDDLQGIDTEAPHGSGE